MGTRRPWIRWTIRLLLIVLIVAAGAFAFQSYRRQQPAYLAARRRRPWRPATTRRPRSTYGTWSAEPRTTPTRNSRWPTFSCAQSPTGRASRQLCGRRPRDATLGRGRRPTARPPRPASQADDGLPGDRPDGSRAGPSRRIWSAPTCRTRRRFTWSPRRPFVPATSRRPSIRWPAWQSSSPIRPFPSCSCNRNCTASRASRPNLRKCLQRPCERRAWNPPASRPRSGRCSA